MYSQNRVSDHISDIVKMLHFLNNRKIEEFSKNQRNLAHINVFLTIFNISLQFIEEHANYQGELLVLSKSLQ